MRTEDLLTEEVVKVDEEVVDGDNISSSEVIKINQPCDDVDSRINDVNFDITGEDNNLKDYYSDEDEVIEVQEASSSKNWAKEEIDCATDLADGHEELCFMINSMLSQNPDKPELIFEQLHTAYCCYAVTNVQTGSER